MRDEDFQILRTTMTVMPSQDRGTRATQYLSSDDDYEDEDERPLNVLQRQQHKVFNSSRSLIEVQIRRGSYKWQSGNEFILELVSTMRNRVGAIRRVVLICDNAPRHALLERAVEQVPGLTLLRLSPYSPMLHPIENIWSKLKSVVKRNNRVPVVEPPGVMEQRLQYLEGLIGNSLPEITFGDCTRSIQHSITFHQQLALGRIDMPVGRWFLIFYIYSYLTFYPLNFLLYVNIIMYEVILKMIRLCGVIIKKYHKLQIKMYMCNYIISG